jgi:hypothetical protein
MKLASLLSIGAITLCTVGHACSPDQDLFPHNRWGIQGSMTTGGEFGIGVADYTRTTEFGINFAAAFYNSHYGNASTFTPAFFGGFRKALTPKTFFAFGLDAAVNFVKPGGESTKTGWFAGPYISLEQMLTNNLMLTGWINPYSYARNADDSYSVQSVFASGGIGLSYLLN